MGNLEGSQKSPLYGIDILVEAELIRQKKSRLSKSMRDLVMAEVAKREVASSKVEIVQSVCNTCVEVCKSSHGRAQCPLYKPVSVVKPLEVKSAKESFIKRFITGLKSKRSVKI